MSANVPVIIRPIPRRPFAVNSASTPSEETEPSGAPSGGGGIPSSSETARFLNSQHMSLDVGAASPTSGGDHESISRAQSILNLTSSTLFGIFSPTAESSTPTWGAGEAETPARDLLDSGSGDLDGDLEHDDGMVLQGTTASAAEIDAVRKASQSLMMLQRQSMRGEEGSGPAPLRAAPHISSATAPASASAPALAPVPAPALAPAQAPASHGSLRCRSVLGVSLLARAVLLFALGMGYGVLVARLRSETHIVADDLAMPAPPSPTVTPAPAPAPATEYEYDASYDWRYLVSWGLSGVILGTLLPWFDGIWDRTFAGSDDILGIKARTAPEVDWALVVRGIGAFAGVVFAMRKLPWTSTLQASVTLALANPFLWYLLDRSKSGLLLAAAVGFMGSAVLMALNLDLMPNPGVQPASYRAGQGVGGVGGSPHHQNGSSRDATGAAFADRPDLAAPETAIWMLSVLFCSCICFGNIGRRLALSPTPSSRQP